jgi:hypothetical protein
LLWVDAARSLAVALALLAHGFSEFKVMASFPPAARGVLKALFHAATPTFFILFGAMLEIVALRRLRTAGPAALRASLLRRSLLCYLAYAATIVAALFAGRVSLGESARAAVLLHGVPHGGILAYYTLALLAACPLVRLVDRAGPGPVLAGAAGLWIVPPLFDRVPWPRSGEPLAVLTGLLIGRPGPANNALLQSLVLIVFGMLLGRAALAGAHPSGGQRLERTLLAGIAAFGLWVAALAARDGAVALYRGYALSNALRTQQAAGYIAISGLSGLLLLVLLLRVVPQARIYRPPGLLPLVLGRYSLAAFSLGNILLILAPVGLRRIPLPWVRGLLAVGHLLTVVALLGLWQHLRGSAHRGSTARGAWGVPAPGGAGE